MTTIQGPAIFLAQFIGDEQPFNSLDGICKWAADLGYKGIINKCTLPIEYVSKGTILEQEEENKIDVNSLINKLKELL